MNQTHLNKVSAKKLLVASAASFAVCLLWAAEPASAQIVDIGMPSADVFGLPDSDIREIIAQLIRSFLGLMGMLLVLIILWSGFKYMTHGGNEDARAEAIGGIKNGIIGLIIMMISYSAADFLLSAIGEATGVI